MLGELKLMPPRTAMKVNCLVMRYLHFESVRGDLQEGYFALLDANSSLPGANSRFPEHKIEVFVLFWPSETLFFGFSSTKSGFLCSGRRGNCVGKGSLTSVNT